MSYNGSGTFVINSSGQPVVTGTVISSTAFNALTADLATGLTTAITKDGQTTTTARILFSLGISSTLTTDATSATTGSIITAGGISTQKALWVGTTSRLVGVVTADTLTASKPVFTDASKGLVSTGTLAYDQGGTGQTTYAAGDIVYASATNTLAKLAIGTSSQVLTVTAGVPSWASATTLAVTSISFGTTGLTPSTATQGVVTVAGTLAVANGGTGVTSSTGTGNVVLSASPTLTGTLTGAVANFTTLSDSLGDVRTIVQNTQSGAYVLIVTDSGKHISISTGGVTIPASVFSAGQAVTIYNNSGSSQTLTQGASATMYLAGTATTGNRTLAQRGVATVLCVASNTFVISGGGLT